MSFYIHQRDDWPHFCWDMASIAGQLAALRSRQGLFLGRMQSLGFSLRRDAALEALTEEVLKSSEIEGELFKREQVRSSVARRLGVELGSLLPVDRHVDGVVEMLLDATRRYDVPLTRERLFVWHAALFPTGWSHLRKIIVGAWRDDSSGPMQVISGPIGREEIHYEAPPARELERDMLSFLTWFESPDTYDPVLKAALAHLWFVTIHPFDDGNGRIGRVIADMALARSEKSPLRFYSMSAQTLKERVAYYNVLETSQKGNLDVTAWMAWFLASLERAIDGAETSVEAAFAKAGYWDGLAGVSISGRQRLMINLLIDGFDGKLTTSKWAKIAKCSHDTALRDIQDLVGKSVLSIDTSGGRSTSYSLVTHAKFLS